MRVTQSLVAKRAGVSQRTVSRVFSKADGVSEKVRKRVLKINNQLGYFPNSIARAMRNGKFGQIAFVVALDKTLVERNAISLSLIGWYSNMIAQQIDRKGLSLVHAPCLYSADSGLSDVPKALREAMVDGAICFPAYGEVSTQLDQKLAEMPFPIVWINRNPWEHRMAIACDELYAARTLTQHLLELGHRRIGYVGPMYDAKHPLKSHFAIVDRTCGIREQLSASWPDPDQTVAFFDNFRTTKFDKLPRGDNQPTAIICYNRYYYDVVAQAAAKAGVKIPRDLSICLFDSITETYEMQAPTRFEIPEDLMAKAAVENLLSLIDGKLIPDTTRLIRGKLIPGSTTAAIKT